MLIRRYFTWIIRSPVIDHEGKVDGVSLFANDVTDLVAAIHALELSKERFAFLADALPDKVWMTNAEGEVQYLNKAWLEYAGIQATDQGSFSWIDTVPPEEVNTVEDLWKQAYMTGTEYNYEGKYRRFDGEYRWHLTHAVPFKDENGKIVYWVGINTDIHDQKIQLQHLQDNEAYFRELSEETPFIVWKSDRAGKCIYLNRKWTEVTGLSVEESLGDGYRKVLLIDDWEAYRQNWLDTLRTQSLFQDKFRIRTAEGKERWFFCQANPHFTNSVFSGYVGSLVDITEQELNSQAVQELSDKKDEFLSIASHELKTPLTSIKASIQLIARAISADNKVSKFAVKASEQLLRLERLIADLLDVSKINSGRLVYNNTVFYFREMLEEVVQSIQNTTYTHKIIIARSDKVIVLGDRFRLEQVIYNFLSNAIKYSPEADKVIVSSEVKDNNLIFSVQDFGIGIAQENFSKTFDRYYRVDDTAMRFQGLGLGLFISAEIIKRHKGHFWVESESGKGSTFLFSLPLNDLSKPGIPETDNQTYYKDSQVDIRYDAEKEWIESNWHGFQNFASIKHGCLEMLLLLEKNHCSKVLNDNAHVLGNWTDASDWGAKVWLPAMEKAGLRYFAWVHSESTFSRLAASKIAEYAHGNLITRFFDHKEDAVKWLESSDTESAEAEGSSPGQMDAN
jgi:PAS domain S-box-containing protein